MPQVRQLNEMQPCWEERLPHCPRYPLIRTHIPTHTCTHTHTHTLGLFLSYPHAVPAPTMLMFIHQPLKGQMQRPVKTKSDLFINDIGPSPLRLREPSLVASRQPRSKKFTQLWTYADNRCDFHQEKHKLHRNGSRRRGDREATEKVRWKNFRRQGGMKRRRDRQRTRPHFSLLMTDCLPSGLNHDL